MRLIIQAIKYLVISTISARFIFRSGIHDSKFGDYFSNESGSVSAWNEYDKLV